MAAPLPTPTVPSLPEPLRLPRGSVRGLLALTLMGTFAYLLVYAGDSPTVLVNATVVVLAFYFGTRGPSSAGAAAVPGAPATRRPWIVRGLLFLGFVGLAVWFYRAGATLPAQLVQVLEVLAGYVTGATLSWWAHRRAHESTVRRRMALVFRDLSALGALALTAVACYGFATNALGTFTYDVEQALSLVVTYYFGSRVIPH